MRIQVFLRPVIGDIFAKVLVFRPVVILYFYLFAEATACLLYTCDAADD